MAGAYVAKSSDTSLLGQVFTIKITYNLVLIENYEPSEPSWRIVTSQGVSKNRKIDNEHIWYLGTGISNRYLAGWSGYSGTEAEYDNTVVIYNNTTHIAVKTFIPVAGYKYEIGTSLESYWCNTLTSIGAEVLIGGVTQNSRNHQYHLSSPDGFLKDPSSEKWCEIDGDTGIITNVNGLLTLE